MGKKGFNEKNCLQILVLEFELNLFFKGNSYIRLLWLSNYLYCSLTGIYSTLIGFVNYKFVFESLNCTSLFINVNFQRGFFFDKKKSQPYFLFMLEMSLHQCSRALGFITRNEDYKNDFQVL